MDQTFSSDNNQYTFHLPSKRLFGIWKYFKNVFWSTQNFHQNNQVHNETVGKNFFFNCNKSLNVFKMIFCYIGLHNKKSIKTSSPVKQVSVTLRHHNWSFQARMFVSYGLFALKTINKQSGPGLVLSCHRSWARNEFAIAKMCGGRGA